MWNQIILPVLLLPLFFPGEFRRLLLARKRFTFAGVMAHLRPALGFFLLLLPVIIIIWGFYNYTYADHLPRFVNFAVFPEMILWQLFAVALPEEYFFRDFLLRRLDLHLHRRWTLFGTRFGPGLFIAAAAFAITHALAWLHPAGLLRFFPGLLFGFVFERHRSLAAATLMHLLCNLSVLLWV